jgi:hypothetical protein
MDAIQEPNKVITKSTLYLISRRGSSQRIVFAHQPPPDLSLIGAKDRFDMDASRLGGLIRFPISYGLKYIRVLLHR